MPGFISYRPYKKNAAIIASVAGIIDELLETGDVPVSLRQLFYVLVSRDVIPKTERAYQNLSDILTKARRGGLIPFDAIVDEGAITRAVYSYNGPAEVLARARGLLTDHYVRDRQAGQDRRVYLFVETAGIVPRISRAAVPYGVDVWSGSGQPSISLVYSFAREISANSPEAGAVVLMLTDLDPGGKIIRNSVGPDLAAFADVPVETQHVALTREQVEEYGLPGQPPKKDTRDPDWTGNGWQLEALPSRALAEAVRAAIESHIDSAIREMVLEAEAADIETLAAKAAVLEE